MISKSHIRHIEGKVMGIIRVFGKEGGMAFKEFVFFRFQPFCLCLILKVISTAQGLVMVKHHIIALDIAVALFKNAEAEIHIVKGNPQFLGKSSQLLIQFPPHHQAGSGHSNHIMYHTVLVEIVHGPVIHPLQLVGGT